MEAIESSTQLSLPARLGDMSKLALIEEAGLIVAQIDEDGGDLLTALSLAKKMALLASEIERQAKARAYDELSRYGKGGTTKAGVKLETTETGVSYDYAHDAVWRGLSTEVNIAAGMLKSHETLLRALPPEGRGITHPETGETYHAYPPLKRASESIKATIL